MAVDDDSEQALFKAVGSRIADLRKRANLSQQEFATAAGVSNKYVWRVEDGRQNLNLRSLSRFAVALQVPLTALLEGIEPANSSLAKRQWQRRGTDTEKVRPGG